MDFELFMKSKKKSLTQDRKRLFSYFSTQHIVSSGDILQNLSDIPRTSVFRNIKLFLEIGLIRRVNIGGRGENYELINNSDFHHEHMTCNSCDEILDFHSQEICDAIHEKAEKMGFCISEHSIGVFGTCKKCRS